MELRVQAVSREVVELLGEDLTITWWIHPHRRYGWVKTLIVWEEDEEAVMVIGQSQSSEFHKRRERIEIDDSHKHVEMDVDADAIPAILDVLASTTLPWRRAVEPVPSLGGSHFGFRIDWAGLETERRWYGGAAYTDDVTARLWTLVDPLVPSPWDDAGKAAASSESKPGGDATDDADD